MRSHLLRNSAVKASRRDGFEQEGAMLRAAGCARVLLRLLPRRRYDNADTGPKGRKLLAEC